MYTLYMGLHNPNCLYIVYGYTYTLYMGICIHCIWVCNVYTHARAHTHTQAYANMQAYGCIRIPAAQHNLFSREHVL